MSQGSVFERDGGSDGADAARKCVMIHMAGVDLLPSAVAQLALRLHRAGEAALAEYLGRAVDGMRNEIPLREEYYLTLLAMMNDECPLILEPLRNRLEFALTHRRHLTVVE